MTSLTSTPLRGTKAQRSRNRKLVTAQVHFLYLVSITKFCNPPPPPTQHRVVEGTLLHPWHIHDSSVPTLGDRNHGSVLPLCPSIQTSLLKKLTIDNWMVTGSCPCFEPHSGPAHHPASSHMPLPATSLEKSLLLSSHR